MPCYKPLFDLTYLIYKQMFECEKYIFLFKIIPLFVCQKWYKLINILLYCKNSFFKYNMEQLNRPFPLSYLYLYKYSCGTCLHIIKTLFRLIKIMYWQSFEWKYDDDDDDMATINYHTSKLQYAIVVFDIQTTII